MKTTIFMDWMAGREWTQFQFGPFFIISKKLFSSSKVLESHGEDYIVNNTPVVHKDLRNLSRSEAELRYIRETSTEPCSHNLHFYTLRKKKTDKACNAWLGICAKGIEIYEVMFIVTMWILSLMDKM